MAIEIYAGSRHCGKTSWIIKKSAKTGIPIAVPSIKMQSELLEMAKKIGCKIKKPIIFSNISKIQAKENILIKDEVNVL